MTSRSYSLKHRRRDGAWVAHEYETLSSGNSPRDHQGNLVLRANTLTHVRARVMSHYETGSLAGNNGYTADAVDSYRSLPAFTSARTVAEQQAYAKLRGRLYSGNAALGVTLWDWRSSRDMVVQRSRLIESSAEHLSSLASRKKFVKKAADSYLETIFGWQPLITDIHAACMTVIQSADKLEFVRGSGIQHFYDRKVDNRPGWSTESVIRQGRIRVVSSAGVRVRNPNIWLLERAGLINPAAVAWDVVPFSFLINMVSNVGSLVNSISDFAGLSFTDGSTTYRMDATRSISYSSVSPTISSSGQSDQIMWKARGLKALNPPRTLEFRLPDLNWGTAAMAASLMVQQAVPAMRLVQRYLNRK